MGLHAPTVAPDAVTALDARLDAVEAGGGSSFRKFTNPATATRPAGADAVSLFWVGPGLPVGFDAALDARLDTTP